MATLPRRRASDIHKDVACCLLRTLRGDGQCVIAEDTTHGRHVLITNHHVLPSRESIKDCWLVLGTKNLKLKVERLYSCCGPDSAWTGTSIHVPLSEKEEAGWCPRKEDWTVVILEKDFAREIELASTRRMTFPRLCVSDRPRGVVSTPSVSLFERLRSGELKVHPVNIQLLGVPENREACIQRDIQDYVSRSRLRYPYQPSGDVGPVCSGAPLFAIADGTNTLSLLGIHCTSPGPDSSDAYHVGLSIDFIMSSLYCGGLEIGCSLVPTLSFLKDMIQKTNALPPAVVLDRVSHSIDCHKNNQSAHLQSLKGSLLYNIGILEFVLTEMQMILSESFNLASSPDGLSVMKLLTALFSLFDGFESSNICVVIGSKESGRSLEHNIYHLCEKLVLVLALENNRQDAHIIKATTELTTLLLNFSYDQGPACCFLKDHNVRILGIIAHSAAAKTDVSTLEACYTAYLNTMKLAHQIYMRCELEKARMEGMEQARHEGEERFETVTKEMEKLKDGLVQHANREKVLMSQLEEMRQEADKLKTTERCEEHVLVFEQLREMEEKNKEQAHELNERKREIEELQHELLLLKQPKGVEADNSTSIMNLSQQTSALRQRAEDIAQYMNPIEISPHLFQKGLLTQDQLSCLNSTHEIKAKNMYIIEKVHSQGTNAVKLFIQCLRETADEAVTHRKLADDLESLL